MITKTKKSSSKLSLQQVAEDLTNLLKEYKNKVHQETNVLEESNSSKIMKLKTKKFFATTKASNHCKTNIKEPAKTSKPSKSNNTPKNVPISANVEERTSPKPSPAELLKTLKSDVAKAIREHKIFTVRGGFHTIRKALLSRGWVEKIEEAARKEHLSDIINRYRNSTIEELLTLSSNQNLEETCKILIKSKLLKDVPVDFCWTTNVLKENPNATKLPMVNKLKHDIFSYTNKMGLCEAYKYSYWYHKPNTALFRHPRCYGLSRNSEVDDFIRDFQLTAAMSLLKWIVRINITKERKLISATGKIPLRVFDFAAMECCKLIKSKKHEDIDKEIPQATEEEWKKFLDFYYKLVHYSNHFGDDGKIRELAMVGKSNFILNNLRTYVPHLDVDGMMNIWILKPSASSQGRGIHLCRTLQYILKTVSDNENTRYVVQKYVERPLLIHGTKFDIRQWFLISDCCPLTIWIYKECYLRFSSQPYNLKHLHESIHLTNNSIQKKYEKTSKHYELPSYNMWDSPQFKEYLANIGHANVFNDIIYPGMKQNILAAVLMHQNKIETRKNCFELYGADFILTEDFQPWLLEINSSPAMNASTPVTSRMCPQVLEDVIKVVIDYRQDAKVKTGGFELIYTESTDIPQKPDSLQLKGVALQNNYFCCFPLQEPNNSFHIPADKFVDVTDKEEMFQFGANVKQTLKNLLQIIQEEKRKYMLR